MISYFYTGDYDQIDATDPLSSHRLLVHINVYALAEKYHIPDLQAKARQAFHTLAPVSWPYRNLPAIITAVYTSTPASDRGLRDIIAWVCAQHLSDYLQLAGKSADEMRDAVPDIDLEILAAVARLREEERAKLGEMMDKAFAGVKLYRTCAACGSWKQPTMVLMREVVDGETVRIWRVCNSCGKMAR